MGPDGGCQSHLQSRSPGRPISTLPDALRQVLRQHGASAHSLASDVLKLGQLCDVGPQSGRLPPLMPHRPLVEAHLQHPPPLSEGLPFRPTPVGDVALDALLVIPDVLLGVLRLLDGEQGGPRLPGLCSSMLEVELPQVQDRVIFLSNWGRPNRYPSSQELHRLIRNRA